MRRVNKAVGNFPRERVTIYVNTDCAYVIDVLEGRVKKNKHKVLTEAVVREAKGYHLIVRHVKAHTKGEDARSWVNNWCDQQARKILREKIINGRR